MFGMNCLWENLIVQSYVNIVIYAYIDKICLWYYCEIWSDVCIHFFWYVIDVDAEVLNSRGNEHGEVNLFELRIQSW